MVDVSSLNQTQCEVSVNKKLYLPTLIAYNIQLLQWTSIYDAPFTSVTYILEELLSVSDIYRITDARILCLSSL